MWRIMVLKKEQEGSYETEQPTHLIEISRFKRILLLLLFSYPGFNSKFMAVEGIFCEWMTGLS